MPESVKSSTTEASLSPMVTKWLSDRGCTVYSEIGIYSPCDHVGVNWNDKTIICVEMKRSCTWHLLRQAQSHQIATPLVYVATLSTPRQESQKKIRDRGLGLIVDGIEIISPRQVRDVVEIRRERFLSKCSRAPEGGIGGMPTVKGDGPRIRCIERVRQYLSTHRNADWKEVFANVPNHYATHRSMATSMPDIVELRGTQQ